ncbi:hypothetical protein KKI95_10805 [Xenorhabdus bovienii]|uniref:hypothetical protein n=1 Tax=Xenorhabdus bovienii TaxID=40576 RepID=UPI00237CD8A9|nr:hypothetical protein [Xenorhabdus bovienii]MDE1492577.1 hypothetical protein [Xenorhabdus bovienii]MDE9436406.1 hypothetical protein [Xenorhabdus bovienii]
MHNKKLNAAETINDDMILDIMSDVKFDIENKQLRIKEKKKEFEEIKKNGSRLTRHRFSL